MPKQVGGPGLPANGATEDRSKAIHADPKIPREKGNLQGKHSVVPHGKRRQGLLGRRCTT
jgi:hypothetical protein